MYHTTAGTRCTLPENVSSRSSHQKLAKSQTTSPLMSLPIELRLEIYRFALPASEDIPLRLLQKSSLRNGIQDREVNKNMRKVDLPAQILQTSRQVCQEAMPVTYGVNHFQYALGEMLDARLSNHDGFQPMPQHPHTGLIRHLSLDFIVLGHKANRTTCDRIDVALTYALFDVQINMPTLQSLTLVFLPTGRHKDPYWRVMDSRQMFDALEIPRFSICLERMLANLPYLRIVTIGHRPFVKETVSDLIPNYVFTRKAYSGAGACKLFEPEKIRLSIFMRIDQLQTSVFQTGCDKKCDEIESRLVDRE